MKKILASLAAAFCLLAPLSHSVRAEGFALTDWSARASALAGGIVARGGDASAVSYNPAAISGLDGTRLMLGADLATIRTTIVTPLGRQKDGVKYYPIPHLYATHKYNDKWSFGIGSYARFGLGVKYNPGWVGRYNLNKVYLQVMSIAPVAAYSVSDRLSLALGPEISWASMTMDRSVPVAPGIDRSLRLSGQGYSLGLVAGIHYKPLDNLSVGLSYHSRMRFAVSGKTKGLFVSDLSGVLKLPDHVTLGVSWAPTEKLSFEADVAYFAWSVYKDLDMNFKDLHMVNHSPKDWKDTWSFSVSAEYRPIKELALRAGYRIENSPVNRNYADYMAPTNGSQRFSLGIGYEYKNWTFDFSYVYSPNRSLCYDTSWKNVAGVYPGKTHNTHARSMVFSIGYKF